MRGLLPWIALGLVGAAACGGDDLTFAPAADAGGTHDATTGGPSPGDAGGVPDAPGADATLHTGNCYGTAYDAWVADPKMCVYSFAENLGAARQIAFSPSGDLFVNNGTITVLWDADGNGTSDLSERDQFAAAPGLNHGLAFSRDGAYVYASSATDVYRWGYTPGMRVAVGPMESVISGIPSGGHVTRTLALDGKGRLIVTIGSGTNVDSTQELWDTRGQIRRFTLPATLPAGGVDWSAGEIIARGMRNEVGIFVDSTDALWAVENGRDDLSDPNFGGDIHTDNPAEEINRIDGVGTVFFGYPLCYTEWKIDGGGGPGAQWADKTLDPSIMKTDDWCKDAGNVRAPAFAMQAHWAPLSIVLYTGTSLPFAGDLILSAHGSWDRAIPVGRVLARAHLQNGSIVSVDPIVGEKTANGLAQGSWEARPVDVKQGPDQAIYFSDDQGGRVFKVGYRAP